MGSRDRQHFLVSWGLLSAIHGIDAAILLMVVPLMPASTLRGAMMDLGSILAYPAKWLWASAPDHLVVCLWLLNSLLWGLALALALRKVRIHFSKSTVLVGCAILVIVPALVPAVSALRHWNSFRAWAYSQIPVVAFPALSKAQMFEDYDQFTNIVQQVFPLEEVNRQVYGIDIPGLLVRNRKRIEHITRTTEFVRLVNDTIVSCRGHHFWIGCSPTSPDNYFRGFVADRAYLLTDAYCRYIQRVEAGNGLDLPVLYFEGEYYTQCDFTYEGTLYPRGMKILRCNGKTPSEILGSLVQSGVFLLWDYDLNRFYAPWFYRFSPSNHDSSLVLEASNKGQPVRIVLRQSSHSRPVFRQPTNDREPRVVMLKGDILYIRLPAMDQGLAAHYRTELRQRTSKPIKKVVIDVRNNGGGGDAAWMSLLSLLLKDELPWRRKFAVKNSDLDLQYLGRDPFGSFVRQQGHNESIDFLNNEEFRVVEASGRIPPDPDSLRLACKIFVLTENVYSATGNFVLTCMQSTQLVSVGFPNSLILGSGVRPFAFSLSNSKLIFTIGSGVDLTDCRTAKDTHHIGLKIAVKPTLEQLLDYYNARSDIGLEKRLTKHDPIFKKVLEVE